MPAFDPPAVWRIWLEGRVDVDWSQWFDLMTTRHEKRKDGSWRTLVEGLLRDQAAVRGVITRMWDLNMRVISLNRLDSLAEGGTS